MEIIRQFEDLFFSTKTNYYFQKKYSSGIEKKAVNFIYTRILVVLFLIKIFEKEISEHEIELDIQSQKQENINSMNDWNTNLKPYGKKRMTFRSFYSAFAPVDGKYNNVEPEYKKLANFFMITIKKIIGLMEIQNLKH